MASLTVETPRCLNDLVGREIALTDWFTITQGRIGQFADAVEDHQWIHVDPERARAESPYGATIAHGFLTLSLMGRFLEQAIQIQGGVKMSINYGLNRVRFPSAVRAGSDIRARLSILATKQLPDAVEATFSIVMEGREGPKPCCAAEWIIRYYTD